MPKSIPHSARLESRAIVQARLERKVRHTRPLGCSPVKVGAYRLVQGSKSPTGENEPVLAPSVYRPGTVLRLEHRAWSDQYRVRAQTAVTPDQEPPTQSGDRWTYELSEGGARKISDSCEFVTVRQGGYTTFVTLTLTPEARERIDTREAVPGEFVPLTQTRQGGPMFDADQPAGPFCRVTFPWRSSVQREASRFFDAAQRVVSRGWVPTYFRERTQESCDQPPYTPITWNREGWRLRGCWYHLRPITDPETGAEFTPVKRADGAEEIGPRLSYLWVAENPTNAEGKRNPHIHVLMRWTVPYSVFPCWANRIESLWGQGYAHIERLKARKAAGYYIAKAAGYLTKSAGDSDQGPIRGNRYGISQPARAPGWYQVGAFAWGIFGELMKTARESHRRRTAPVREVRDRCRDELKALPIGHPKRRKLAAELSAARKRLDSYGGYVGRWQMVVKGQERADHLLIWAQRQGWEMEPPPTGRLQDRVEKNVAYGRWRRWMQEERTECLEWVRNGEADRWEAASEAEEERIPELPEKPKPEPYGPGSMRNLQWWAARDPAFRYPNRALGVPEPLQEN